MKLENGRLEAAGEKLTREDFDAVAEELGVTPGFAVKMGDKPVAAMNVVDVATPIVTINTQDGSVQAEKMARPGDAIMTRLNKDGTPKIGETGELDQWVVDADKLEQLYNPLGEENEHGQVVGGNNEVLYIELPAGGEIEAPWGGSQEISEGVLQFSVTTGEVYLNEGDAFEATFDVKLPSEPVNSTTEPSSEPTPENLPQLGNG